MVTAFSDGYKDESEMVPAPKKLIVNERKKKDTNIKRQINREYIDPV